MVSYYYLKMRRLLQDKLNSQGQKFHNEQNELFLMMIATFHDQLIDKNI